MYWVLLQFKDNLLYSTLASCPHFHVLDLFLLLDHALSSPIVKEPYHLQKE